MMKNIIDLIKEKIRNHKKLSIIALLLFLLIGGTVGYVLLTNNETNNNPKVTQTNNQNKNPDTNVTGSNNAKKKEDKKSDDKKSEEVKTDVTETSTSTENTTSINVSNNTSSNKNTVSDNGCKTVYHEAVTHNVYHEAVTQQVWVVDTPAHDETTYTLVYYVQFSNGEKWYQDGSADFANRVADYTASNGLSYSVRAENQPNTVHYDEVGHYETQVVSPARTETVVDTPAYTTCE